MLKGGRFYKGWDLNAGGCSCCNSRSQHRKAKKSAKAAEKKFWKKDTKDD